jgi:hypothetical protein
MEIRVARLQMTKNSCSKCLGFLVSSKECSGDEQSDLC